MQVELHLNDKLAGHETICFKSTSLLTNSDSVPAEYWGNGSFSGVRNKGYSLGQPQNSGSLLILIIFLVCPYLRCVWLCNVQSNFGFIQLTFFSKALFSKCYSISIIILFKWHFNEFSVSVHPKLLLGTWNSWDFKKREKMKFNIFLTKKKKRNFLEMTNRRAKWPEMYDSAQ